MRLAALRVQLGLFALSVILMSALLWWWPDRPSWKAPADAGTGTGTERASLEGADASVLQGVVEGRVLDEEGRPVSAALIRAGREEISTSSRSATVDTAHFEAIGELGVLHGPIPYPPSSGALASESKRLPGGFETTTDREGHFRISLPGGRVTLSASHPDYGSASATSLLATAGATATLQLVLVRGKELRGQVLDERGQPIEGARLEIEGALVGQSDAEGRLHATGLGATPYRIRVSHPDFVPFAQEGVKASEELHITLAPGGGIAGQARDRRTGETVAGLVLELRSGHERRKIATDGRGEFSCAGLPPGAATLLATAPDYAATTVALQIPPGQHPGEITVRDLRLELERAGWLSGQVRGEQGAPMPNVAVAVGELSTNTNSEGRFVLRGVPTGRVRVEVRRGEASAVEEVEVRANEESRIDLRLQ